MAGSRSLYKMSGSWAVVSLGGSLLAPTSKLDQDYLARIAKFFLRLSDQGFRCIIVAGGGYAARWYQEEARALGVQNADALDWIGIYATHLNAALLVALLGENAGSLIGKTRVTVKDIREHRLLVAGGQQPGQSSDAVAVRLARLAGADIVVNASNIPYVYEHDPNTHDTARAFASLRWNDYLALIPPQWNPGLSTPFDPTASREAQKAGMRVAILNGKNLRSLEAAVRGMPFEGTLLGAEHTALR